MPTATNPTTGEKLSLVDGAWVPLTAAATPAAAAAPPIPYPQSKRLFRNDMPEEASDAIAKDRRFNTQLTAAEEKGFQKWKAKEAPNDSGYDYDLRGAYKAGLTRDPASAHFDDEFKKPNHPSFSTFSRYAKDAPDKAGTWDRDRWIPPGGVPDAPIQRQGLVPSGMAQPAAGMGLVQRFLTDPIKRGYQTTKQAAGALGGATGILSPETAADLIAQGDEATRATPRTPADEAAMQRIGKASTFLEAGKAVLENPATVPLFMAESAAPSAAGIVTGLAGSLGGPLGFAAGIGLGSGGVEAGSTLIDTLQSVGVNPGNRKDVARALASKPFMDYARSRALKAGVAVGTFDAVAGRLAGRFVEKASGVGSFVGRSAADLSVQAGAGMAGEASKELALGQELQPGQILPEGIAELPGGVVETAIGAGMRAKGAAPTPPPKAPTPPPGAAAPPVAPSATPAAVASPVAAVAAGTPLPGPSRPGAPSAAPAQPAAGAGITPRKPGAAPVASVAPTPDATRATAPAPAPKPTPEQSKAVAKTKKVLTPADPWVPLYETGEPDSPLMGYVREGSDPPEIRTPAEHQAAIVTPLSGFEPQIAPPEEIAAQVAATKKEAAKEVAPAEVGAAVPDKPTTRKAEAKAPSPKPAPPATAKEEVAPAAVSTSDMGMPTGKSAEAEPSSAKPPEPATVKAAEPEPAAAAPVAPEQPAAFVPSHTDTERNQPVMIDVNGPVRRVRYPDGATREERSTKGADRYQPIKSPDIMPETPPDIQKAVPDIQGATYGDREEGDAGAKPGVVEAPAAVGEAATAPAGAEGGEEAAAPAAGVAEREVVRTTSEPDGFQRYSVREGGKEVAAVTLGVKGDTVRVGAMEAQGGQGALGPRQLRELARAVKRDNPEAKWLEGARVTGARSGGAAKGADARVSLDKLAGTAEAPAAGLVEAPNRPATELAALEPAPAPTNAPFKFDDQDAEELGKTHAELVRSRDAFKAERNEKMTASVQSRLDEFIKGIKKDHGDKAMKAVAAVSNRIRAEQARKPKTAPAEKPFLATTRKTNAEMHAEIDRLNEKAAAEYEAAKAGQTAKPPVAAAAQDGESLPPAVPDVPSAIAEIEQQTEAANKQADLQNRLRKRLLATGAVSHNGIDYSIQNTGTRGNGGFYWRKVEDGVRIEKGPGGRDVWSRELALDKLMAEMGSDIRNATPIEPPVPDVPKVQSSKTRAISKQPAKAKPKGYGDSNKTFTKAGAEEARAELKKLMSGSQLNAGFDPKIVFYATQLGGYHVEAGARSFVAYSKEMLAELGEGIQPLLAYVYNQIRDYPGYDNAADMDSREDVAAYLRMQAKEEPIASPPALPDVKLEEPTDVSDPEQDQPAPDDRPGDDGQGSGTAPAAGGVGTAGAGAGRPPRGARGGSGTGTKRPGGRVQPGTGGRFSGPDAEGSGDQGSPEPWDGPGVRAGDRVPAGQPERDAARAALTPNFSAPVGGLTRQGSWLATAERNVSVIEMVKVLTESGAAPTQEQQELAAAYTGWGAGEIANKLFPTWAVKRGAKGQIDYNAENLPDRQWRDIGVRLKAALTNAELATAVQSTQYAHYTSEDVTRGIWSALDGMGFKGGRILEPGMGVGLFPVTAPAATMAASHYTGVEMDGITAAIAKVLLPREMVIQGDYIERKFPDGFFDLAVGNPPFASIPILRDPAYRKYRFSLHDYFFAKTIDKLRPGGVMAFVTSRYTMDKLDPKARDYLTERADLLGAIRLPRTAFKANAGTEVVTDILFFQKRPAGTAPGGQAWAGVAEVKAGSEPVMVNQYYAAHPEMVLGQHSTGGSMYRSNEYTVDPTPGVELAEEIAQAVRLLPKGIYQERQAQDATAKVEAAMTRDMDPAAKKEGQLYVSDAGKVMVRKDGVGVPVGNLNKVSANDEVWLAGAVGVRDKIKEAQRAQLDDAPDWEAKLKALNKEYDAFVKTHGRISEFTSYTKSEENEDGEEVVTTRRRFKYARLLDMDVEGPLLAALEKIDDETGIISKGAFLRDRTLKKPQRPEINTAQDALFVSLDERGRLDLPHIASLLKSTVEKVREDLGDSLYEDPSGDWQTADAYLSGEVRGKLQVARVAAEADPRFERNVKALLEVQPRPLSASQVTVKLGSGWVAPSYVDLFASEVLDTDTATYYEPTVGQWDVKGAVGTGSKKARKSQTVSEWNHPDRTAVELLKAALNNEPLKVYRTDRETKKTHLDTTATAAINEIADKMRERFKSWVWTDAARAADLLNLYNEKFNNIAPRKFDGSHLTLPGLSTKYTLHPHQKRAIWRIVQTGNTYLAHAVGAGKTLEMIAAAMEQRRLGLINKPMFVVPNHMLNQFASEFLEAYPAASIMVADDKNFHGSKRQQFIARAALNDLDGIIITHSAFGKLGTKPETRQGVIDRLIEELQAALDAQGDDQETRHTRKKIEAQIQRITEKFAANSDDSTKDQGVMIEDMGVDFVNVDEAHEFRKLDFVTAQQVKGIDPNGSQRAMDLFIKTRWLDGMRPGRSMVFASGTPVTNTMAELYSVMKFLDEPGMDADGLHAFDAWAQMFGEVAVGQEQNAAGVYENVARFAKFVNIPELMKRVRKFGDFLTGSQLGRLVERPDVKSGGPQNVVVTPSPALVAYMKETLLERIKVSKAWKPSRQQPGNPDPLIAIITDGRLSAIDMRFVDKSAPDDPKNKLNRMIDGIIETHQRIADDVFTDPKTGKKEAIKGGAQIVFSSVGFGEMVAASRGFDVRGHMTKRFAKGGIKASDVAWMGDYDTDAKKQAMFKEMRAGTKRILIGSPKNMGTGLNVQKRLKALHYLSPPWYPSDVEQPHGRIVRQGNWNKEVELYWYANKGTYDSTAWGMVARKASFIEQAYTGDDSVRVIEDISEVSQYEMAAALAAGDERAITLAKLNAEINRLGLLQADHGRAQSDAIWQVKGLRESLKDNERRQQRLNKALELHPDFIAKIDAEFEGRRFDKHGEYADALLEELRQRSVDWSPQYAGESKVYQLGTFSGRPVVAEIKAVAGTSEGNKDKIYKYTSAWIKVGPIDIDFLDGVDESNIVLRNGAALATAMQRNANGIRDRLRNAVVNHAEDQASLEGYESKIGAPFEYQAALIEKIAEAARLRAGLAAVGIDTPEPGGGLPTREQIEGWENEGGPAQALPWDASDVTSQRNPMAEWENEGGAVRPLAWDESDLGEAKTRVDASSPVAAPALGQETAMIGRLLMGSSLTSPEWVQVRQAVEADLALLTRRLAGEGIKVKAFDAIRDAGSGRVIGGAYLRGMISVAITDMDGRQLDTEGLRATARHEVIHFLKESGVIPQGAWKALEAAAPGWRKLLGIDERYGYQKLSEDSLNEEAIAEAYAKWSRGELKLAETKLSAMRRIKAFLAAISDLVRRALGLDALPSPQSVFAMIESGALAEAASSPGGALATTEEAKTALPSGASRVTFSPDDLVENQEKLEELNYGVLNYALGPRMRGSVGRNFDHFRRVLQDRFLPIRRTQEAIEAALGRPLDDEEDAWTGETLSHGKVRQASFERDENFRKPIAAEMQNAGLTLDEVDEYLNALAAPARNAKIAAINPRMPDGGSGMTNDEADRHLKAVAAGPAEKARALATIRGLVRGMMDDRLQLMVDSGLIDAGTAANWREEEPEYVPLRGKPGDPDAETESALSKMRTGRRLMGIRGPLEPRAMGRGSRAPDILATAFALADETARRAAKNEVELQILRLATIAPDDQVWEVSPVQRQAYMARVVDPVTGAVTRQVRYRNAAYDKREDTMVVRDGGHQVRIRIKDPNLLKAISGMGAGDQHAMIWFLSKITGTLSKMNTLWHPEFALTNAFKDAQAGLVNLGVQDLPGLKREVLKNMRKAFAGTELYLRTGKATTPWAQHAEEARRAGLVFGFAHMGDVQTEAGNIKDAINALNRGRVKAGLVGMGQAVRRWNESVDTMIRLSTYVALRNRGFTQQQAVAVAKRLTVDFDRKGEWGPAMNALYMFSNVGFQGTAILASAVKSRNVQKWIAGIVALGVAQELLNNLWGPPDDDDDDGTGLNAYDKIPQYEKQANMILAYGPNPGQYVKIPMPFGYSWFHNIGRLSAAYIRGAPEPDGQPVGLARTIGRLAASFGQAMIPPGMGDLGVPTFASPFVQIMGNEDYFGRPIMPTRFPGDDKPDSQTYYPSVSGLSKFAAQTLNSLTGGDEFQPGLVDVSPESISHVVNVYAGAVGAMAVNAVNSVTGLVEDATGTAAEDPKLGARNIPFVRKFVGSSNPFQTKDITYQRMAAIEILHDRADTKDERAKEIRRTRRKELALVDDARKLRRELSGFSKQRRADLANEKLSVQQKRSKTDALAVREARAMRTFNVRYMRAVSAKPAATATP